MTTKNICPATLASGYDGYSPIAIKYLFSGHKANPVITFPWAEERDSMPALLVRGSMRLCRKQQAPSHRLERTMSTADGKRFPIAANKHLTMQIASQIYSIQTALNGLCFTQNNEPLYVTQYSQARVYQGKRTKDIASIMDISEEQPLYDSITWLEVASVIKQIAPAWPVALERFFVMLVFNYIFCNESCDLHSFSIYEPHPGDYQLVPARDFINSAIIRGLNNSQPREFSPDFKKSGFYVETGHPCIEDFKLFASMIGLREERVTRLLKPFTELPVSVYLLIDYSFLSDKEKEEYKRQIDYRVQLLNGTYRPIEALTETLSEDEELQFEDYGVLPQEQAEEIDTQSQELPEEPTQDESKEDSEPETESSSLTYGSLFDF
jgi:serine/threonine-protein kinase HipA